MSSEKFNDIFHLVYYSFILNLRGVLSRRIYFTLFMITDYGCVNDGGRVLLMNML